MSRMLRHLAIAIFLATLAAAQTSSIEKPFHYPAKVRCRGEIPHDFACAILFAVDPPIPDVIDIARVAGGEGKFVPTPSVIREVSVILDGTLYTVLYDPPLKRDDTFSGLRTNSGIPARRDGDNLVVIWPNGRAMKAKIIRREKILPNRCQPA